MAFKRKFYRRFRRKFRKSSRYSRRWRMKGRRRALRAGTVVKKSIQDRALYVKLRYYVQAKAISTTQPGMYQYALSGNGLYDPDYTGTGTQPLGFDQYMAFYQRYTVTASKIAVQFTSFQTTTDQPSAMVAGVMPSDSSTWTSTDWQILPLQKTKIIGQSDSGIPTKTCKYFMKTKKVFGTYGVTVNTDDYSGDASNNPSKQWFWLISAQNQDPTISMPTGSRIWTAKITFYVKFWQPQALTTS